MRSRWLLAVTPAALVLAAVTGQAHVASQAAAAPPAPAAAQAPATARAPGTAKEPRMPRVPRVPRAPAEDGAIEAKVDKIFARWTAPDSPGCAVGVSVGGKPALARAYGMADLEHDVRNRPDTIFEAGSVSKQFTAAAILLLARDGKLSLDDPARKYLPELPSHTNEGPAPITIRQMLTHTSGLRDWGSLAAIGGWPRTARAYTHAHVLDIVSRQRALNFTPGTRWSYSNTGYNLAAIIVARVSGQSFAAFTHDRIFQPLGMTHTSWRDDFTRVVKGRAMAYESETDGFHTLMPFENVHGNGGLLTTVGDLLTWNQNFVTPVVGDAAFVAQQQDVGRFADGRPHDYAFGLRVAAYKGLPEVSHSGATAGYRSDLIRFPGPNISVAVLCNADNAAAVSYAYDVADLYLAGRVKSMEPPAATHTLTAAEMDAAVGIYRNTESGSILRIARDVEAGAPTASMPRGTTATAATAAAPAAASTAAAAATAANTPKTANTANAANAANTVSGQAKQAARETVKGLRIQNGPILFAQSATRFVTAEGFTFALGAGGTARLEGAAAVPETFERMPPADATAEQLASLAGVYVNDEAEVTFTAVVEGGTVVLRRRPDASLRLTPLYADAFSQPGLGTVVFERAADGRVTGLRIVQDRVWALRFTRQDLSAPAGAAGAK